MTEARPRRRGWVLALALAALAVGSLLAYGDARELVGKLGDYRYGWFGIGLALATSNYGLRFLRWQHYLARIGVRIPRLASLRIFVAGFSMSVTPGKLGEVLKSGLLYEEFGIPVEESAPVVLAERVTDLVALVLLVALSGFRIEAARPVALLSFALVGALVAVLAWPALGKLVLGLVSRLGPIRRVEPRLRAAHASLLRVLSPSALFAASALATLAWSLECLTLGAVLRGFDGVSIDPWAATFAYSGPTVIGALSMFPGGLIVSEGSMTAALEQLATGAVTPAVAAGCTLLVRLCTLWWAVLLGVIALALGAGAGTRGATPPDASIPETRSLGVGDAAETD